MNTSSSEISARASTRPFLLAPLPATVAEVERLDSLLNVTRTIPGLRIEYDVGVRPHPHATTNYGLLTDEDYCNAVHDLLRARQLQSHELNFHLPFEVQFARFRNEAVGNEFMDFVDAVGRVLGVMAVWENAPIVEAPDWRLVLNTEFIPTDRYLCLDTGHLILGSNDKAEALRRLDEFWERHGAQVRLLHLHINNFAQDQHLNDPGRVIEFLGFERFRRFTANASYIFERGL